MNKFSFLLGLGLLAATTTSAQEEYKGSAAAQLHDGASWLQKAAYTDVPTFIRLGDEQKVPLETFPSYTKKFFQLSDNYGWKTIQTSSDELGFIHYRLNQTFNGYPVEGAVYLMHTKDGQIRSLNGQIFNDLSLKTDIVLSESQAFDKALATIGAKKYMWEMEGIAGNVAEWKELAAKPKGELVIICDGGDFTLNQNFHLAYKFDIYANTPISRDYVYIDAQTGAVLHKANRLHTADTPGTAVTKYSGTRAITTDSYNGSYRLRESGLGGGIRTVNLQTGTNYASFVDFTDTDNNWNNVNAQKDEAATDAHWAAEQTYSFFKNHFNRNGIDGNNDMVRCFMHYDVSFFNAFWDGANMVIGDGDNTNGNKPLSAIDIIGHEMTHGVTQYTANLNYQGESGALNESMSDIMGTTIELEAKPTASWDVGSDIGVVIRSMSNPSQYNNPDTYGGSDWINPTSAADNGGVHTNSGVQNYWYYLVAQGGSGTNDNGVAYNITGIGLTKARDIAYRMLSVYLGANSQYADARTAAIQSATDLYGACTNEVQVVTNAWRAVGVGAAFVATVTADFSSPTVTGCKVPFNVQFTNSSINGGTFSWNFGDGTTSTANSPLHTYTTFGIYNVFLFADGGTCGTDNQLKNAYIDVQSTNPCIVVMNPASNQTQTTCTGILHDTGGTGNYQDNTDATITIAPAGALTVTLNFQSFDFETGYDYLYVYDGPNINSPLIGQYDGTNLPNGGTITSTTGSVTVRQVTDQGLTMPGFALSWQCLVTSAPPASDFIAQSTTSCDGSIIFVDKTNPTPNSWLWDFGDGATSTQQSPTHSYATNGTYTVKLTATNSFGANTKTRTSYVTINMPNPPTVTPPNPTILSGQTATLNASASGTVNWYNATQNLIATGITYTTPPLTATTTYYVKNVVTPPTISGGPANNTIGNGANFNNPVRHLKFDVLQHCTLKSVKAYAQGGGSRTIEHRDASGNVVINDTIVNLVNGMNVINLNFPLTPGTQYQLGVKTSVQNPNLYRNNGGAVFPYNIGTYASITGTDATTAPNNYYFFYDWKIVGEDCESGQVPVTIIVEANGISEALANGSLSIYPNPSNGFFTIDIQNTQAENMEVAVFNLLGQQVAQIQNRYTDHLTSEINLSQHPAGTYIVQCKVGEQVVFKKYIKED